MTDITTSTVYWMTRLTDIKIVAGILMILTLFGLIAWLLYVNDAYDKPAKWVRSLVTAALILVLLLWAAVEMFLPSTRDMAAIVVLPRIANSRAVNDLGEGVTELAREWLEELKPRKEERK